MSTETIKAIARRHYEEAKNVEAAFAFIAPDVVFHGLAGAPPTYEGWKQGHALFVAAFPDMDLTIENQIAEGDTVVTRWTMRGTHRGELMGMPPTGARVTVSGISSDRIVSRKVVEHWAEIDLLGMVQQLGTMPAPGQEPE